MEEHLAPRHGAARRRAPLPCRRGSNSSRSRRDRRCPRANRSLQLGDLALADRYRLASFGERAAREESGTPGSARRTARPVSITLCMLPISRKWSTRHSTMSARAARAAATSARSASGSAPTSGAQMSGYFAGLPRMRIASQPHDSAVLAASVIASVTRRLASPSAALTAAAPRRAPPRRSAPSAAGSDPRARSRPCGPGRASTRNGPPAAHGS